LERDSAVRITLHGGTPRWSARFGSLVFAGALVFLYLYSFPYFEGIRSANELPRIYLTMAMWDRGAFDIGPELRDYQPTPDTSTYKGKLYSNKAPGMSMLAIPAYAALRAVEGPRPKLSHLFYWLRLFSAALPALLFLLLLDRLAAEVIADTALRRLLISAYALGTMALPYGILLFSHQLSAALIGASFIWVFLYSRSRAGKLAPLWAGFVAGCGVLVDYQVAFVGPPLFVYLLVRARPSVSGLWARLRPAMLYCLGAGPPLLLLLYYHHRCFGSPFSTGYQHLSNPVFASWTKKGLLGLSTPELSRFAKLHFSPDDGLFYYSPFLILAFVGLVVMARQRNYRAEFVFSAFVMGFFVYFNSALSLISGWDVGPRYVIAALPFYMLPLAFALRAAHRHLAALTPTAGLIVASIAIYLAVSAIFPHYPDSFSDPFYDVTVRFGQAGYVSYNAGWLLGLEGLASLVPYVLVALGLLLWLLWGLRGVWHKRLLVSIGAFLIAGVLLGSYYTALRYRQRPVRQSFLPWMERVWEPRHPKMDKKRLFRPFGPQRRKK
jgi:hypothetical protein